MSDAILMFSPLAIVLDPDVPDMFSAESENWGYDIFMTLSELEDPSNGYILNDKCIVEVEIFSVTFEGIEPTSRLM
ncbi:hypothetical protein K1719_004590 [Acacia pycnantha]|nr:hypothetical protein K1719_004590 [Acacia pycnantha]